MAFFHCTDDYLALPHAPESWIIQDLLPVGGSMNVYGKPKAGKSFLCLQMAEAIADPSKPEFLGYPILTHGPVIYLQADTPRGLWRLRIIDFFTSKGRPLKNVYFADKEIIPYPFDIADKAGTNRKWLADAVKEVNPVAVFIDTLREVHMGDENDSGHMQIVVNALAEACRPAAIVLISHSRKTTPDGAHDLMNEGRGSSYTSGRMDSIMKVTNSKLYFQGRSIPETSLAIEATPLFSIADVVTPRLVEIMKANPHLGMSGLVPIVLKDIPTLSPEAARSRLRRLIARTDKQE